MKFNIFALLLLISSTCGQSDLLGHLNEYENCYVVPESSDNVVVFWTIVSSTLHMAMSSKNYGGFMGVGWNKNGQPSMLPSDAVIATVQGGVGTVTDSNLSGYSTCIGTSGVCSDVDIGGTNNILSGEFIDNITTSVSSMKFSRLLDTGDSNDFVITNANVNMIYALGRSYTLGTHRAGNAPFSVNLFTPRTTCPTSVSGSVCSGHGNCTKGCCVCDADWDGSDCSIQTSTPPAPTPQTSLTAEIVPSDYPFKQQLHDKLTVYWRITDDKEQIEIALDCDCTGWVAFGPSKSSGMVDSDVILGYFENGNLVINDHYITSKSGSCPGVCVDTNNRVGGEDNILDYNGNNDNNKLQIKYIRKLKTGDNAGDIDIVEGEMNAIWGFHPDSLFPAQHESGTKDSIKINFFSGEASETSDLKLVHGILMFLAWSVFVPITSFLARYLKKFKWWFNVHRYVNGVMMAVVIASFGIAISFTSSGEHFNKPHSIIGLIIIIIAIAQPVIGIVADRLFDPERKSVPMFPDKLHWVLGWGGLALGLINVLLGLILYDNKGLTIGYGVYFAVVGAFLIIWAIYKQIVGIEGH